jgi:glycosyltransferase involved in cell wall biosynthesis
MTLPPVHAMWLGEKLSGLEKLTLASFAAQGHEVTLWAYDDLTGQTPPGVALRDAEQIFSRARIIPKSNTEPGIGVGKGSVGGVFSDLFRYKVLYEQGGIWTDMDVTALKPLEFGQDYAFRPHRMGAVGSVMQCPKGSRFLAGLYEATEAIAGPDTPWLLPIQLLNEHIIAAGLQGAVVREMTNLDAWGEIRPFIEGRRAFPRPWYAVHWMNELWRTLNAQNGALNGRHVTHCALDKDAPPRGSMLHELYRAYGLADPYEPFVVPTARPVAVKAEAAAPKARLDVLVPALAPGGAERIVLEVLGALAPEAVCRLHVLGEAPTELKLPPGVAVHRPQGGRHEKLRAIALEVLEAGTVLHTHLIRAEDLEMFWAQGVRTIPVLHNARPGWQDAVTRYNTPMVPLVVACAGAVAAQARESGLTRPLTVIRHELQAHPQAEALAKARIALRRQHGIGKDTLLIGMVGQFKLQKAYHRAAGVLAAVKAAGVKARLLVLGGWDHEWGSGRTAYESFMRAAVEAGVVADVLCPGAVDNAAPYYAAFDVLLNTSAYEGYSVAMLEALASGCPVVASDVGGARELPEGVTLITEPDNAEAYAEAILDRALGGARVLPPVAFEPRIVPQLWRQLGAVPRRLDESWTGALILTAALERGGPAASLVRLAAGLPLGRKLVVGVCGAALDHHVRALEGAKLLSAAGLPLAAQADAVLAWLNRYRLRTLCFWNTAPELKLLLAKLLETSPIRLIDVSPGPMLFDELAAAEDFGRRVALSPAQYFARLDRFVTLYKGGEAPGARNTLAPLGVPEPPGFVPLPAPWALPPRGFDPALVVGTICRLVPDKNVELLVEVARKLRARLPGATLMVVGGPDARSVPYAQTLMAEAVPGLIFTGPCDDPFPYLRLFRVFLLTGARQGCPNASLEAMAMGLPVVAQPDGGVAEQVVQGETGYLAETAEAMARRAAALLRDEPLRARLGTAARRRAAQNFSISAMVSRYDKLLFAD